MMPAWLRLTGFVALVALVAACGSRGREEVDEFADAVPVLSAEQQILADPILAGQSFAIPPAYINPDWSQTAGEADHALIHVAAPTDIERLWSRRVISRRAKDAPLTSPPIVGPERVYVLDAVASVVAVDPQTGKELWRSTLTPDIEDPAASRFNILARIDPADLGFGGGLALAGNRLFVASGFGFVAALDPATGEELWRTNGPGPMRNPPTAAEGLVIAVSISNEVIALDQATGEEAWTFESFEEAARFLAASAPAVAGESVIVPFSSGEISALTVSNGRPQWQAVVSRTSRLNALSVLGDIAGSPVIDRGAVFSVSQSGQMAGIDLRTGTIVWEVPVGGFHTPWLAGETLFVISNRGDLVAVNRQDGKVRWTAELPAKSRKRRLRNKRIIWAGPILAGGRLYVTGSGAEMLALSPTDGEILETYKLKDKANLPAVVANEVLYVLTENGTLEAWGEAQPR